MDKVRLMRFVLKPLVFATCLVPLLWIAGALFGITGNLGANPVEAIQDHFGNWGLRFIMIALAVTPLSKIGGWNSLLRFRRMLGLFAFFYVLLHFLSWLILDQGLLVSAIAEDIAKRPFITLGFAAFLLLTAMAVTSPIPVRRRMGRRWQQLHYSVYAVGILAVCHYWWQVKADFREPLVYALILAGLLGYRIWHRKRKAIAHRRVRGALAQHPTQPPLETRG
jgi:sulfoxide reductase heme-binding subunit YedZ